MSHSFLHFALKLYSPAKESFGKVLCSKNAAVVVVRRLSSVDDDERGREREREINGIVVSPARARDDTFDDYDDER